MKRKERIFIKTLMLFIAFSLTACNNDGSTGNENDSDSFFSRTFGMGSANELQAGEDEIKSALDSLAAANELRDTERVQAFYGSYGRSAWKTQDARNNFYAELEKVEEEGLFPEDYHRTELSGLLENPTDLSTRRQAALEVLLTDAYLQYAHDLYYGKLDPNDLHGIWGIDRKERDLVQLLQDAAEEDNLTGALAELKPDHQVYSDLKTALKEYRELKSGEVEFTRIPEGELIEPGQKDERITLVADRLKQLDLLDEEYNSEQNIYDEELQAAIREFQEERRLQIDRILGNNTIKELNMSPSDRYNQILANLERWRWYPRDLGEHYILINIPDFRLAVVRDGDTVKTHNVVAGTAERPTPIFSDSLQYVVLNPEWTIPPTIKSEDVIPSAAEDPEYLANNNITVLSEDGERVDPENIDWESDEALTYTYVQEAGPSNPLGRVKIIYPNDYAIYLHDTPAQSLFEENERAESSGCVRVEEALDLADYVTGEDLEKNEIDQILNSGNTSHVAIKSPIRVHHFYWTAWRDNGETIFAEDVYSLDERIYSALQEN